MIAGQDSVADREHPLSILSFYFIQITIVLERHRANAQIQICKRSSGWCGAEDSLDANWGEQDGALSAAFGSDKRDRREGGCVALPRRRARRLRALPAEEVRGGGGHTLAARATLLGPSPTRRRRTQGLVSHRLGRRGEAEARRRGGDRLSRSSWLASTRLTFLSGGSWCTPWPLW